MKNEPIPLDPRRPTRASKNGLKIAGAVAASVLALGTGTAALAGHIGQGTSPSSGSANVETEQSLPASDLFGASTPTPEATAEPSETPEPSDQPVATAPSPAPVATHKTEHETETEHDGSGGSSTGGDD